MTRVSLLLFVLACTGRPSAQECEEAFAQLERVSTAGQEKGTAELGRAYLDTFRKEFMDRCVKEGTREEVQCMKVARTQEDLDKCAGITK